MTGDHRSALATIVEADKEREWLLKVEEKLVEGDEETEKALNISLNEVDSDNAEARAAQLLAGLGFDKNMQAKPTREYSGGWRMRIALAQALFTKPDLLLLDEPTNHLDVHALTWLEFFLAGWERTVLIVSHDRGFLNKVTTATMFIHGKRLRYYGGNYDTFLKVRAEHWAMNAAAEAERAARRPPQEFHRALRPWRQESRQAGAEPHEDGRRSRMSCEVDFDDPYLKLDFPSASTLPCRVSPSPTSPSLTRSPTARSPTCRSTNCNPESTATRASPSLGPTARVSRPSCFSGEIQPTDGHVSRHAKLIIAKRSTILIPWSTT